MFITLPQGPILFEKESTHIQLNLVSQNHEADTEKCMSSSVFCLFDLVINWMWGRLVHCGIMSKMIQVLHSLGLSKEQR